MTEPWRDIDSPDKNPNALTYGIEPNAPATIRPTDIDEWKATVSPTFKHYFQERYDELVREYEKLVEEYSINKLVYESTISFEPLIGEIYFLYQKNDGTRFLSLVSPETAFWSGFLGKYRLRSQYTWERVL